MENQTPFIRKKTYVILAVVFAILAWLICSSLSSYVFYPKSPQLDSSVFRYVGMVMQDGGVPYRDTFDHKGPLIYFFNYLGLFMGKNGIWYIEFVIIISAIVFCYKTMRFYCSEQLSLAGTIITFLLLYDFLGEGNYTEEYALPFIVCALYVFAEYFITGKTSRWKLILCGVCATAVLMLRVNMIAVWVVFPIGVIINEFRHKSNKLISYILYFSIGAVAAFLPILIYLWINGAIKDFWEQYIVFNFAYSAENGKSAFAMHHFMLTAYSVLAIVIMSVRLLTNRNCGLFDWSYLAYIGVSLWMVGISGRKYNHYGIILATIAIVPIALLLKYVGDRAKRQSLIISGIIAILILAYPWIDGAANKRAAITPPYQTLEGVISNFIKDNTSENDLIIQCGHKDIFYVLSERMAASKYSYPLPIAMVDNSVYEKFFDDLRKNLPVVIITDTWTEQDQLDYTEINKRIEKFTDEYGYVKGPVIETYTLYFAENSKFVQQLGMKNE